MRVRGRVTCKEEKRVRVAAAGNSMGSEQNE